MIDLKSFLESIKADKNHFLTVKREVDAKFEASAVLEKLQHENRYPAVYYEKVKGYDFPVVSNVFADRDRIAIAFGVDSKNLNRTIRELEVNPIAPVMVSDAAVQEVVYTGNEVDLTKFPVFTHNAEEVGPYISCGMLVGKDPETGIRNVGMYRHLVQSKNQIGVHFAETGHGRLLFDKWQAKGEKMPVAITIGHHPLVYLGALSFVPFGIDEYTIMGSFIKEPLRLVKCKTVDLEVPAEAEIVLEGYVETQETTLDGPIGEYTTVYGKQRQNPFIKITAITMRKNPIYFDCFNGHIDHMLLGGTPRLGSIYRAVKTACPTVVDVYMPPSGTCRFACYISIKKRHEGEAKNAICAAIGADPFIKLCIVVDDDVDIFNDSKMLLAINTRMRPRDNLFMIPGAKTNALDPTVENELLVTKIGIDATKPLVGFPNTVSVPGARELDLSKYIG
ncbi:MAG: UbiD family decarboxylase [Synergistaceae bacterium]|jgi:2,5-furandicarboxylate decarboxylase 1|nr:UbiD family decarboxylase [Synergistaceae bacterium]